MQRLSNRYISEKSNTAPQVQYVDRIVEVPVQVKTPDAIIQYVDRETIHEIQVPGDTIVMESQKVDLEPLQNKDKELEEKINKLGQIHDNLTRSVINELELQRRALVSLKMQRDVDRKRRLTLIHKLRKHRNAQKRSHLILSAALLASVLLTVSILIIK